MPIRLHKGSGRSMPRRMGGRRDGDADYAANSVPIYCRPICELIEARST
jgi:hypothetical protein